MIYALGIIAFHFYAYIQFGFESIKNPLFWSKHGYLYSVQANRYIVWYPLRFVFFSIWNEEKNKSHRKPGLIPVQISFWPLRNKKKEIGWTQRISLFYAFLIQIGLDNIIANQEWQIAFGTLKILKKLSRMDNQSRSSVVRFEQY